MKRKILIAIVITLIFCGVPQRLFSGLSQSKHRQEVENVPDTTYSEDVTPSASASHLVGAWYCSKINSCNNMNIILRISQDGDTLLFSRRMFSDNGVGESDLEGTASVTENDPVFAEFTNGEYSITEKGCLPEYFHQNNRWNIYTTGDFTSDSLTGSYKNTEK